MAGGLGGQASDPAGERLELLLGQLSEADGMPGAARRLGAAAEVVGLGQLHRAIRNALARLVRP